MFQSDKVDRFTHRKTLHQPRVKHFPQIVRKVEANGLDEEDEPHPLIVRVTLAQLQMSAWNSRVVVLNHLFTGVVRVDDAWMGRIRADCFVEGLAHGECLRYPAITNDKLVIESITQWTQTYVLIMVCDMILLSYMHSIGWPTAN